MALQQSCKPSVVAERIHKKEGFMKQRCTARDKKNVIVFLKQFCIKRDISDIPPYIETRNELERWKRQEVRKGLFNDE